MEFEIVRLAGRPDPTDGVRRQLQALALEPVDWSRVGRIGLRHGVLCLTVRTLERHAADFLPDEVRQRLRGGAKRQAMRSLAQVAELLDILEALEAVGVVAVPYKGPALSAQLYGSAALRESCDIDLLVAPVDVAVTRSALLQRGYREHKPMAGARGSFMLGSRYSQGFKCDRGPNLELHWAFTNGDVAFPLSLEELRSRLVRVFLGGRTVPAFAWEDLVLILGVHGAKHCWNRLEWIVGFAEAARRIPEEAWPGLLARARELRCYRALLLGLHLAHCHAGLVLPERSSRAIAREPSVTSLAAEVLELLLDEDPAPESSRRTRSLENDVFHIRIRDGLRARVRYLMYRLTTPSRPEEWRAVEIAGRSVPLHGFLRPIRAVSRLVPAAWRYLWGRRVDGSRRVPSVD